jgi:CBS domain-containing protein
MTMVGEISMRDVVVATAETTVADAAGLMRRRHVGTLVIVDTTHGGAPRPRGIVTDRDIVVEVVATGLDPRTITIGDIMRRELVTAHADDDALDALQAMRTKGVRRLPVVNEQGLLLGLVAFDDLLDLVADQLAALNKIVGREQAREERERR